MDARSGQQDSSTTASKLLPLEQTLVNNHVSQPLGSSPEEMRKQAGDDLQDVKPIIKGHSKLSCMYLLTKRIPTNYDMLMFRTLNQDLEVPNANEDYEAAKIRDELMPFRGMVELMLPHLEWDDRTPPIASFYSYAAVMKQ
ncbi:hypothetical protein CEUSTIGMA_g3295.t1 [Chlamydomonas eustigma]|uniref:Uncharacterized protein n=1 Tax=Chlamydomonas eustigma TaxID=1157962 RepID=A0A250WZ08_9CHLO|nr:hypothetical protein CEUSTIGMA_g3295.t1 [Chlamydomonas eustigma]|eukprot:GAX75852.1 hypothetical protein CEUSTIGMA_g3295.t1 [Chlamydomonas eustigma]